MSQRYLRGRSGHSGRAMGKALQVAACGDLPGLQALLVTDPTLLNAKSAGHNRTLLWEATRRRRWPAVRYLVEGGADPNVPGRYRHETLVLITPICLARRRGDEEWVRYFATHGAEIDVYRAAFLCDGERVRAALAATPEMLHIEDPADTVWTVPLLAYAIAGGCPSLARDLIALGAAVRPYSRLLLEFAGHLRRGDLLELLLRHGADARHVSVVPFVADPEMAAQVLAAGASVDRAVHGGWPPIVYVSRGDKGEHPERVRWLLEHGADPNARGPHGATAVHTAAKAGFTRVVEVLLAGGADVNARRDDGSTPLRVARRAHRGPSAALLSERQGVE